MLTYNYYAFSGKRVKYETSTLYVRSPHDELPFMEKSVSGRPEAAEELEAWQVHHPAGTGPQGQVRF